MVADPGRRPSYGVLPERVRGAPRTATPVSPSGGAGRAFSPDGCARARALAHGPDAHTKSARNDAPPKIRIQGISYWYSGKPSLEGVTLDIPDRAITVLFGPAGGGKTTLMRLINRLNDIVDDTHMTGRILLDDQDICAPGVDISRLRRRVGMVFALPLALPGTVRDNVLYGPRLAGERDAARLSEILERSLKQSALWAEVKDRLDASAMSLSGGQQQRLCIARSLALQPEVLLLDEPTSGLDPISTAKVEESLAELRERYAVVIVPHSVQQAARIADYAAFFLSGELVERGTGSRVFTSPIDKRTEDYMTGRFG